MLPIASSHNLASVVLIQHSYLPSFPFHISRSLFAQILTKFKRKTRRQLHMLIPCGAIQGSLNISDFCHRFQLFCHIAITYISLQSRGLVTLGLAFDDQGQFASESRSLFRSWCFPWLFRVGWYWLAFSSSPIILSALFEWKTRRSTNSLARSTQNHQELWLSFFLPWIRCSFFWYRQWSWLSTRQAPNSPSKLVYCPRILRPSCHLNSILQTIHLLVQATLLAHQHCQTTFPSQQ